MSNVSADEVQNFSDDFEELCRVRHATGASEYGPTAFVKRSMFDMIAEELADAANYARYQYIKIRLMQKVLPAELQNMDSEQFQQIIQAAVEITKQVVERPEQTEPVNLGPQAFIPQGQGAQR